MRQFGPVIIQAMPSAAPVLRVLPQDPADGWRLLPHHNGGSPRTSAGGSLMDSSGVFIPRERSFSDANPAPVRDRGSFCRAGSGARMLASSPHLYLLDSQSVKR